MICSLSLGLGLETTFLGVFFFVLNLSALVLFSEYSCLSKLPSNLNLFPFDNDSAIAIVIYLLMHAPKLPLLCKYR